MQKATMRCRNHIVRGVSLVVALTSGFWAATAQAQVAHVASVQHTTEKKTGDAGAWRAAAVGAGLSIADSLRTGKRSKADVKFTDGSLLRLGQLSSVSIQDAKVVRILSGEVLGAMVKNGGRILAGTAVGEITGSVGVVRANDDGSFTFELLSGAMFVTTPKGRADLRPGKGVTTRADGSLTNLFNVPPLLFEGGTLTSELSTPPQRSVAYAGSPTNIREKLDPARLAVDENRAVTQSPVVTNQSFNPFQSATPPPHQNPPGSPFPTPFPTGPFPVPSPFPTLPPPTFTSQSRGVYMPPALKQAGVAQHRALQVAGAPAGAAQTANAAELAADTDTTAARNHITEGENGAAGSGSGADVMLLGALTSGNGDGQAYGGRLHAFSTDGHWFLDLAATPLRLRFKPQGAAAYTTTDLSAVSNATITYRSPRGEMQIGRQRFIQGPTQASVFGSLVRQGAREIMDAARFAPNIGQNRTLEVAYLYDAFPHNLPYKVAGAQHGYYGRFGLQEKFGNFGLNLLHYNNAPVASTTGATVDFAFPLFRDQIELYGEVGRDTFRRRLTTGGLTFPGLYDRTNFDVYLEFAKLRASSTLAGPPNEVALRVYRKIGKNVNLVGGLSHFSGAKTSYTLGMSIGARLRNDNE